MLKIEIKAILSGWGEAGANSTRPSSNVPTLSGVMGLIGNALGMERTDPRLPLLWESLEVDILMSPHQGSKLSDFQTFSLSEEEKNCGVSTRFYDVGVWFCLLVRSKNSAFPLGEIEKAFRAPKGLLYLGRKNCPLSWVSTSTGTYEELIAPHSGWVLHTSTPHPQARYQMIRADVPGKNRTFKTRKIYVVPVESPSPA